MKPIVNQAILGFTRDEATRLSGLSEGQLRDWSDGLYAPHWSSGLYSFLDLVALRTLAKLRKEFGIRPAQLKRASAFLRKHSDRPWSALKLGVGPKKRVYFWDPVAECWLSADDAEQSITSNP